MSRHKICSHREWTDEEDDNEIFPTGEPCTTVATHTCCNPIDSVVCNEHRCRCSQLIKLDIDSISPEEQLKISLELVQEYKYYKNYNQQIILHKDGSIEVPDTLGMAKRKEFDGGCLKIIPAKREAVVATWRESGHNGGSYDTQDENVDFETAVTRALPLAKSLLSGAIKTAKEQYLKSVQAKENMEAVDQDIIKRKLRNNFK